MTALPLSGLNNSVAVRFRDVVAFGSIDWIQDDQLQFQVAARIQRDDVVEMRMELTGWPDTVYGLLKILQRTQSPEEGVPRFLAALVRMEERDLALLSTTGFSSVNKKPPTEIPVKTGKQASPHLT